jgi:hypothetical protein
MSATNYTPTNRMSVSSLVLGILAILTSFIPFLNFLALLIGPLGMIFGFIAIRQIKASKEPVNGGGKALTGLLLSLAGTLITIMILIVIFWAFS